jgi:antirestriction protein
MNTTTTIAKTETILLHAQPYNIGAAGFYFGSAEDYTAKAAKNFDRFGQFVEEYEIQFIDGESIDCELARAWGLNQGNFADFLRQIDEWDESQKILFIIANGECGAGFDPKTDDIDQLDIDIYQVKSFKELAEQFVDDGLFGNIPDHLANYIDYQAIARDLAADYSMTDINGTTYAYRLS